MKKPVTFAVCGCGCRGYEVYSQYEKKIPDKMKIVAIADIDKERLDRAKNDLHIDEKMCFSSAEEMLKEKKLADVMIIATQDDYHVEPALKALELGYDILLEKPISPILEDCIKLRDKANELHRKVVVCHVLRYTPFFLKLKELINDGSIGDLVSVDLVENVAYWHAAHSFVRGNWRNSEETSPMILAKSCHDMDILRWLVGKDCLTVSSFGSLKCFNKENAPIGSADYCMNGCKIQKECPYDAYKIYMTGRYGIKKGNIGWPISVLTNNPTEETVLEAIKSGPYGRCVYHCDNNVVDHQVVAFSFDEGITATFTMCDFTKECYRNIKIMGSRGEIVADMLSNTIKVSKFGNENDEIFDLNKTNDKLAGHGGGDTRLIDALIDYVADGKVSDSLSSVDVSVESHIMALAAEKSRLHNGESIKIK